MSISIQHVALGIALCDADHKVREMGGNNQGPRISEYLQGIDPPINVAAPWCAAAVQYWFDLAGRMLGIDNPLDQVRLEAYVQSYYDSLRDAELPGPELARHGDLALFNFGGSRWDHIGMVVQPPYTRGATFWCVEGNTNEAGSREGDGVLVKPRKTDGSYPVTFIRPDPNVGLGEELVT